MSMDTSYRWWEASEEDAHGAVKLYMDTLEDQQSHLFDQHKEYLEIYTGREMEGNKFSSLRDKGAIKDLRMNVTQSAINTARSKLTLQKPRVYFTTEGGTSKNRRRTKRLQKFNDAVWYAEQVLQKMSLCFLDGQVFGTAALKIHVKDGRVLFERVQEGELIIDENVGRHDELRTLGQRKMRAVEWLKARYPNAGDKIDTITMDGDGNRVTERVEVVEMWHLPSGPKAKDGRHVICIDGCTLDYEKWKRDSFPFSFFRWQEKAHGFRGQGVVEQAKVLQQHLNSLLKSYEEALQYTNHPFWLEHEDSKLNDEDMEVDAGNRYQWGGNKEPSFRFFPAAHPQVIEHMRWISEQIYALVGVSLMSAQGQRLTSHMTGAAQRQHYQTESVRFATVMEAYQQFAVDIVTCTVDALVEAKDDEVTYSYASKDSAEKISWKQIKEDMENVLVRPWPSNSLMDTPEGRMQTANEMMALGMPAEYVQAMVVDDPSFETYKPMPVLQMETIDMIIDELVFGEEYIPPDDFLSPDMCLLRGQHHMLQFKLQKIPEEQLEGLTRWMGEVADLKKKIQAEAMAQQAAMQPQAPGQMPAAMPPQG